MCDLESHSEQIKEVYAQFGLAMYQAQCVERQLAILLATAYGPGPKRMTRSQYDDLLASLFRKTFGGLFQTLRKTVDIPEDFETTLSKALDKRNWLAHHYFWERAGHFMTEPGRRVMIGELSRIALELDDIDQKLIQISREWMGKIGMSEEVLQAEMEKLIADAISS